MICGTVRTCDSCQNRIAQQNAATAAMQTIAYMTVALVPPFSDPSVSALFLAAR